REYYVKDDRELNDYLLKLALNKAELEVSDAAPAIAGDTLTDLAQRYTNLLNIIDRMTLRYDPATLYEMTCLPRVTEELFADHDVMRDWAQQLQERLDARNEPRHSYEVQINPAAEGRHMHLQVTRYSHGVPHTFVWHEDFFTSPEYAKISYIGNEINYLFSGNAIVR